MQCLHFIIFVYKFSIPFSIPTSCGSLYFMVVLYLEIKETLFSNISSYLYKHFGIYTAPSNDDKH